MPSFRRTSVLGILEEREGLQRVDTAHGRAYVLTRLIGSVSVGDEVIVNTTAVDLGLGTGGWHVVHWNLSRDQWSTEGGGHIMKLRYTSLQTDTGAVEETVDHLPAELDGMPVVVCTVHSQLGVVASVLRHHERDVRIAYVMTDGAALPLALSDLVARLRDAGVLDVTITAGHAFGGDLEAVSVPSALAVARHIARADVAIVAMGPGVVGTGTQLGTTAVEAAAALDACDALGGRPILCARASSADERERHRGRSHHTTTVLELARVDVEVPDAALAGDLDVEAILDDAGIEVTTMGRGPRDDPEFFAHCAAAAVAAARHVRAR